MRDWPHSLCFSRRELGIHHSGPNLDSVIFRVVQYRSSTRAGDREKTGMTVFTAVYKERRNRLIQAFLLSLYFSLSIALQLVALQAPLLPGPVPGAAQELKGRTDQESVLRSFFSFQFLGLETASEFDCPFQVKWRTREGTFPCGYHYRAGLVAVRLVFLNPHVRNAASTFLVPIGFTPTTRFLRCGFGFFVLVSFLCIILWSCVLREQAGCRRRCGKQRVANAVV